MSNEAEEEPAIDTLSAKATEILLTELDECVLPPSI